MRIRYRVHDFIQLRAEDETAVGAKLSNGRRRFNDCKTSSNCAALPAFPHSLLVLAGAMSESTSDSESGIGSSCGAGGEGGARNAG